VQILGPQKVIMGNFIYQDGPYEVRFIQSIEGEISLGPKPSTLSMEQTDRWHKRTGNISLGDVIKIEIP